MTNRLLSFGFVLLVIAHSGDAKGGDDLGMVQTQFKGPGDDCAELARQKGEAVFQETGDLHKVREEVAKFTMECRREPASELSQQAQVLRQEPPEFDEASHAQEAAQAKKEESVASDTLKEARAMTYDAAVAEAAAARKRLEVAKILATAERLDAEGDKQEATAQQNMTEGLRPLLAVRIKAFEAAVEAAELAAKSAREARRECKGQESITEEAQTKASEAGNKATSAQASADFERDQAKAAAQTANQYASQNVASDDPYITSTQNTLDARTQMTEKQTMDALALGNAAKAASNVADAMDKQLEILCTVAEAKKAKAELANETVSTEKENLQVFEAKIKEAARETERKWDEYKAQEEIAKQQERYVASNKSAVAEADLAVQKAERVAGAADMTAATRQAEVAETQQKAVDAASGQ